MLPVSRAVSLFRAHPHILPDGHDSRAGCEEVLMPSLDPASCRDDSYAGIERIDKGDPGNEALRLHVDGERLLQVRHGTTPREQTVERGVLVEGVVEASSAFLTGVKKQVHDVRVRVRVAEQSDV